MATAKTTTTHIEPKALWRAARIAIRKQPTNLAKAHKLMRTELGVARLPAERARPILELARKSRTARLSKSETLNQRYRRHLEALFLAEIQRRGGETAIQTESGEIGVTLTRQQGSLVLLRAEGWRYYSRRFGSKPASIAYLAGVDDNGPWAVRVPGAIKTIGDALGWVEPAEVRKARHAGKRVLRQGDVYALETTRAHDGKGDLPAAHRWDSETRTLTHSSDDGRDHAPLHVPFPCRFVRQRVYEMGRGGRRSYGD